MPLPVTTYTLTISDHTMRNGRPETGSMSVFTDTLSQGNLDLMVSRMADLETAIAAITIGNLAKSQIVLKTVALSGTPAASPLAQREDKWLLRYHDATSFQKANVSIPTADLTLIDGNTEFMDLTINPGLALKTAFENIVVSPFADDHAVILDSVQFVGRNL